MPRGSPTLPPEGKQASRSKAIHNLNPNLNDTHPHTHTHRKQLARSLTHSLTRILTHSHTQAEHTIYHTHGLENIHGLKHMRAFNTFKTTVFFAGLEGLDDATVDRRRSNVHHIRDDLAGMLETSRLSPWRSKRMRKEEVEKFQRFPFQKEPVSGTQLGGGQESNKRCDIQRSPMQIAEHSHKAKYIMKKLYVEAFGFKIAAIKRVCCGLVRITLVKYSLKSDQNFEPFNNQWGPKKTSERTFALNSSKKTTLFMRTQHYCQDIHSKDPQHFEILTPSHQKYIYI